MPATGPTRAEIDQMQQMLSDALDAGFLGLSTLRSSFSKLEGTRYPARQLPSTYAKWSEFHALNTVLRRARTRAPEHPEPGAAGRSLSLPRCRASAADSGDR